jgi:predicted lipoprotein with Yx(FWY)xxD motif
MWIIVLKSILALVSIFTGGAIFYKYIKDNKILVFLAGSVSILSAVYLFSEIRKDIDKLVVEKKVEAKVEEKQEEIVEVKKVESKEEVVVEKKEVKISSGSKWFSPTDKSVTWKEAKELCKDNGGRLPTIEELKEVVTDCGGTVTKDWESNIADKNKANERYQSCYKEKGFKSSYYWSSSTIKGNEYYVWIVAFDNGNVNGSTKDYSSYVRCVRDGQ